MRLLAVMLLTVSAANAEAKVCDYRPSSILGGSITAVTASVGGLVAASGSWMKASGIYTLVHATSGLTMLGSSAAGSSAAGTVGIIAGTGGAIGAVGSVVMSPVTITVGALTAVGGGGFETYCYLTDYDEAAIVEPVQVEALLRMFAALDDKVIVWTSKNGDILAIHPGKGETRDYPIEDLYFERGLLMHRELGVDTEIAEVRFYAPDWLPQIFLLD